jgi:hypothetical protein
LKGKKSYYKIGKKEEGVDDIMCSYAMVAQGTSRDNDN